MLTSAIDTTWEIVKVTFSAAARQLILDLINALATAAKEAIVAKEAIYFPRIK